MDKKSDNSIGTRIINSKMTITFYVLLTSKILLNLCEYFVLRNYSKLPIAIWIFKI